MENERFVNMNRRKFLKVGAVAMAAVALPKNATSAPLENELRFGRLDSVRFYETPEGNLWAEFDPAYAHANGLLLVGRPSPKSGERMTRVLYDDMAKHIPPRYRRYVEIHGPVSVDYGRAMNIAWRYLPPGGAA